MKKYFVGYSIIEMAIALVVLGLLLGAIIVPLQVRLQAADQKEVDTALEDSIQSVIGYAIVNRTSRTPSYRCLWI